MDKSPNTKGLRSPWEEGVIIWVIADGVGVDNCDSYDYGVDNVYDVEDVEDVDVEDRCDELLFRLSDLYIFSVVFPTS